MNISNSQTIIYSLGSEKRKKKKKIIKWQYGNNYVYLGTYA